MPLLLNWLGFGLPFLSYAHLGRHPVHITRLALLVDLLLHPADFLLAKVLPLCADLVRPTGCLDPGRLALFLLLFALALESAL